LFHDFCFTSTQTRVSAAAAFDQISVAVATANQSSFMTGLLRCERGFAARVPRARVAAVAGAA
jgi:hypothetical protein